MDNTLVAAGRATLKRFLNTPLYTNAVYLMTSTIVVAPLGYLFWAMVARLYTEAEVGYSSAIISIISLLSTVSLVGLNVSLLRFLPQSDKPERLLNSCFTLGGLISLAVAVVFLSGMGWWSPALAFIRESLVFASLFILSALLATLSSLVDNAFVSLRKARLVLVKNLLASLLRIPLPVLFVFFFKSFGIVASWGLALGIALVVSLWFYLPSLSPGYRPFPVIEKKLIVGMWRYSLGNYLAGVFMFVPIFALPIMVVNLLGPQLNAYFYIAWMLGNLLTAIPLAVAHSLFVEGAYFEHRLRANIRKSFKLTFLLLFPAVLLIMAGGRWLLLGFGESYVERGLVLLWILSISSLPVAIHYIYGTVLGVTGRLGELIALRGVTALAMLWLSSLALSRMGIVGAGYAWLAVNCLAALYTIPRLVSLWRRPGVERDGYTPGRDRPGQPGS